MDAWFAFGQGLAIGTALDPDDVMDTLEPGDAPALLRALACFGVAWDELTHPILCAQMRTLYEAPPWFARELMTWEPDELRALRGNVCGGQESFVRALRALADYRHSLDYLPPLGGGSGG